MVWEKLSPVGKGQTELSAHSLSASTMNQELFQLLAIFLSDREIVGSFEKGMTVESSKEDPLVALREHCVEPMVTALLVETAVKNRWKDDAWGKHPDGKRVKFGDGRPFPTVGAQIWVGRLSANDGPWEELSLRESCNKIIHADWIEPQFDSTRDTHVLTGVVETRGRRGTDSWRTEIDIRNYVRASLFNMYGGIAFPRNWMRS
jgi:hypothetical protein